ncbi:MAG: carboxypeptidase-like regulatory domain-containing protein [Rhodothermaceae bacterium]|nr:carboxypeptidase-like regulatory domain-containing protein [Rhodothermaceae bacterium]
MRLLFPALVVLLALAPASVRAQATVTLTGTVTADDGEPLPGANVFIARSQRGTVADAQGRYRLAGVPLGAHRLVASFVGFETAGEDLVLRRAGETRTIDFRLREAAVELGEVTAEAERDDRWRQRYERFQRRFLGETANAAETEILNPFVLDFEERRGTLSASAREPLVIENRALGYRIRYDLTDFEARSDYNFFYGEAFYEELEPTDPTDRARWERNRRAAYRGSFRHLLRSLIAGTADAQGFSLYLLPNQGPGGIGGGSPFGNRRQGGNRFPTTEAEILKPARQEGEYVLEFRGVLQTIYRDEPEEPGFLEREWARERRPLREVQTSELRFPIAEISAQLDRFGEELDPRSITVSGYMAFERFADELPKEYGLAESGLPGAVEAVQGLENEGR